MKNKKIVFILIGTVILLLTIGGTVAYFSWNSTSETKDATVDVTSVSGTGVCNKISDNNRVLFPVSTRNGGRVITINAKQLLSEYANITWYLTINSINTIETETTGLKHQSFKYELINSTTENSYGTGNFANANASDVITLSNNNEKLTYNTDYTFTLFLWIDGTLGRNPSDMTDQSYNFNLACEMTGTA